VSKGVLRRTPLNPSCRSWKARCPRVSVLLPVRDAQATLPACLASLAAQTLADHEVVAVDDGSADQSGAILDAAARADPRLRVLHQPPLGLVAALNLAARSAEAPLLARLDADDVAHPDRLALQAERLGRDPATDVLGCRVRLVGDAGPGMRDYVSWQNGLLDHEAISADLLVESPLAHPSVMMRAETLRALGGYRAFDGPEDYDLWLRAHAAGCRFAKLPEVLLDWRDGPARLTRRDPRYAPARFFDLKLEALLQRHLRAARPLVVWGAGPIGKSWARALGARGLPLAAFVEVDGRKIGQHIHRVPVVGVSQVPRMSRALHLAAVGRKGARARIRAEAQALGIPAGDLVAVA
jgi:glycosyltransferase involved in cell wall biosynthesis